MSSEILTPEDRISIPGLWDFEYTYFAGDTASRFFHRLRDDGAIFGRKCPSCKRVLVPARSYCDACYVETEDWVEVGPEGVLDIFSIVATQFPGLPPPPFIMAYVTLDGADTALLNHVTGTDLSDIDAAAYSLMKRPRVRAKFKDDREARITDFHFEIIE
ncbi:Zn-ribbon domain-containing OB-fold protein [Sphingobium aquiterrae]|uniref:Zn-ribbon domain-containing OB-fold protein n=1 Tax=Sphingobium aquiterrae TaxID=2038656 RepID=UPI00301993FC